MSSRRYVKRIWRVPQHRGPVEYLGTALAKLLRKHGWPAKFEPCRVDEWAFEIHHVEQGTDAPEDFWDAVEIATRVIARTYRVDATGHRGYITFNRPYVLTTGGHFKEVKP